MSKKHFCIHSLCPQQKNQRQEKLTTDTADKRDVSNLALQLGRSSVPGWAAVLPPQAARPNPARVCQLTALPPPGFAKRCLLLHGAEMAKVL